MSGWLGELWGTFDELHMRRALWLCLLAGFSNGFVSGIVVLRKSALMVSSLSHSLLPGIAIGVLVAGLSPWSAFVGAAVAGLIVGLGSVLVARGARLGQETVLAVFYSAAFAAGILLLSYAPGAVQIEQYLFGNVLFASDDDLRVVFWVCAVTVVTLAALQRPLLVMLFEPAAAQSAGVPVRWLQYVLLGAVILVLISSLQAVGCILAVGLLVTPGACVALWVTSPVALLWGGALVGSVGAAAALVAAHHWDWGPGSAIVLVMSGLFLLSWLVGSRHGVLPRWWRARRVADN